jgi:hypothetical protein
MTATGACSIHLPHNAPITSFHWISPALFTTVNLMPLADKADHHRPIANPSSDAQEILEFRGRIRSLLRRAIAIVGRLSLVDLPYVFSWKCSASTAMTPQNAMHITDECPTQ